MHLAHAPHRITTTLLHSLPPTWLVLPDLPLSGSPQPHFPMSVDVSRVWSGVDESQRKVRWSERIDRKLLDWKLNLSSLHPSVKEEIDLQLQPGFFSSFSPPLTPKAFDDVRLVLRMDAAFNHRTALTDGQPQLVARLLASLSWDTRIAFATLQSLNSQLKADAPSDPSRFKVDALTLASLLSRDLPELASHLNACGYDVVDLSSMLSAYLPSVYATAFPPELVSRCVDVVLLDPLGSSFLFAVFYGTLRANLKPILQQSSDSVLQFIADLPHSMTRQQVQDAFTSAYKGVRSRAEQVNAERKKKSWALVLARPGPVLFSPDVGEPAPPSSSATTTTRSGATSGASTASSSRRGSGSLTPPTSLSPVFAPAAGDGHVTVNLRDLSAERMSGGAPTPGVQTPPPVPAPSASAVLQSLAGADKETDVAKLRELIRAAQAHIRATTAPPPLPSSMPSTSTPTPSSSAAPPPPLPPSSTLLPLPSPTPPSSTVLSPSKSPSSSTIKYAELADYLPLPCIHMDGYLLKSRQASKFLGVKTKGGKAGGGGHSTLSSGLFGVALHRRWFVLQGEFLAYFKQRGEKAPSRGEALWVRSCWVEELSEKEFGQWGYGFEVRMRVKGGGAGAGAGGSEGGGGKGTAAVVPATEPLFVLFTSSAKERQTWVEVLKRAAGQA